MDTYQVFTTLGGRPAVITTANIKGNILELFHVFSQEGEYMYSSELFFEPELEGRVLREDYWIPSKFTVAMDGGFYYIVNGVATHFYRQEFYSSHMSYCKLNLSSNRWSEVHPREFNRVTDR